MWKAVRNLVRRSWQPAVMVVVCGCEASRAGSAPSVPDSELWIRPVHIVNPRTGAVARDRTIRMRDGVVTAIVSSSTVPPANVRIIDGGGSYAVPGLWDVHVHVLQGDTAAAEADAARLLGSGITHVRDMGSSLDARRAWLARQSAPGIRAPTMISAGPTFWAFELPYGDRQAKVLVTDTSATEAAVAQMAKAGVDFIKVYDGFDRSRLPRLMRAAAQYKLPVDGHAQPGMPLAEQAALGMRTIEHLDFGTLSECTANADAYFDRVIAARFRNSGESIPAIYAQFAAAVDTPDCRARLRRAAAAGLTLTPTLVASYLPYDDAMRLQRDLPARQQGDCATYLKEFDGLTANDRASLVSAGARLMRIAVDAGVPMLAGTDAPTFCSSPGTSLAIELRLMAEGGLPLLDVLRSATLRPASTFGVSDRFGDVATGRAADLALLRSNPLESAQAYIEPFGVYTQRQWHDRAALAALRTKK